MVDKLMRNLALHFQTLELKMFVQQSYFPIIYLYSILSILLTYYILYFIKILLTRILKMFVQQFVR